MLKYANTLNGGNDIEAETYALNKLAGVRWRLGKVAGGVQKFLQGAKQLPRQIWDELIVQKPTTLSSGAEAAKASELAEAAETGSAAAEEAEMMEVAGTKVGLVAIGGLAGAANVAGAAYTGYEIGRSGDKAAKTLGWFKTATGRPREVSSWASDTAVEWRDGMLAKGHSAAAADAVAAVAIVGTTIVGGGAAVAAHVVNTAHSAKEAGGKAVGWLNDLLH